MTDTVNGWIQGINDWWQDVQEQLAKWFEQQLTKLLNQWVDQCCGSALLPAGAFASVWFYCRKKGKTLK